MWSLLWDWGLILLRSLNSYVKSSLGLFLQEMEEESTYLLVLLPNWVEPAPTLAQMWEHARWVCATPHIWHQRSLGKKARDRQLS